MGAVTHVVMQLARLYGIQSALFIGLLLFASSVPAQSVAPYVGPWEYGENRCGYDQFGYSDEGSAIQGGADRFYNAGCGNTIVSVESWPTPEAPRNRAACGGSSNSDPTLDHSLEVFNSKWAKIGYWYGSTCGGYSEDGLVVMRRREVACPPGFEWVDYVNPVCRSVSIEPLKQCTDNCEAGANPSNPVQSALGTKYQVESDFQLPGGLVFARYYTSLRGALRSSLGAGWRHSYEIGIAYQQVGGGSGVATAWLHREDGKLYWFNIDSSGTITSAPDVPYTLERQLDESGVLVGWRVRGKKTAVEERFDASGRIREQLRPGMRITFEYHRGRLAGVRDQWGRVISFAYDRHGYLAQVVDPEGKVYRYHYDQPSSQPFYRLVRVTYPDATSDEADNPTRIYHYEQTPEGWVFDRALTGITDESGSRYASWQYGSLSPRWATSSQPRANASWHGGPGSQVDRVTFTYSGDGSTGTTTIVDSLGATTQYSFVTVHGVRKVASVTAPCAGCEKRATLTYDANGFIDKQTDFRGTQTDLDFNSRGLEVRRIEAANSSAGERRTIETDWHAEWPSPVERRTYGATGTPISKAFWTYNSRGQTLTTTQTDPATGASRATTTTYCEQA